MSLSFHNLNPPRTFSSSNLSLAAIAIFLVPGLFIVLVDLRHFRIPNPLLVVQAVGIAVLRLGSGEEAGLFIATATVPCLVLVVFAAGLGGRIGMGDIKFLAVIALFIPVSEWFLGLTLSGICGLLVFLALRLVGTVRQCDGSGPVTRIPFGPVIFVSYLPLVCRYWLELQ